MKLRMKAKIVSVLLSLTMVFTMMGAPVYAASQVYFYSGEDEDPFGEGFNTENAPIVHMAGTKWFVIGYAGEGVASTKADPEVPGSEDTMTLIAADVLKTGVPFRAEGESEDANHYGKSNLKTEIEKFTNTFLDEEKAGIVPRDLAKSDYKSHSPYTSGIAGDPVEDALLWPLSTQEAYYMNQELRKASARWWLRSHGEHNSSATVVFNDGNIIVNGDKVSYEYGIRPAFNFDLESIIFKSTARNGKQSNGVGPGSLMKIAETFSDEWKLTLKDGAHSGFAIPEGGITGKDKKLTIKYSGAVADGEREYISAIVSTKSYGIDGEQTSQIVTWYGKLALANSDNPECELIIPNSLEAGDEIYVFNEQCNADSVIVGDTAMPAETDYASKPVLVYTAPNAKITEQPSNLTLAYGDTTGNVLSVKAEAAEGNTLSYQWYYKDSPSLVSGTKIDDATDSSYTVPTNQNIGKTLYYYCEVTEKDQYDGEMSSKSKPAAVTIKIVYQTGMEGDGSAENPYRISNYEQLKEFADIVNGTHEYIEKNIKACAILVNDIDAAGKEEWIPIGMGDDLDGDSLYTGTFDGQNHTIAGLRSPEDYEGKLVGLFGYSGGTIKNVGVVDSNFSTNRENESDTQGYGGIVGVNGGIVENCYHRGTIKGNIAVGGVAGRNWKNGIIRNCYNTGYVSGIYLVGGVIGVNGPKGEINNCYNTGDISGSGTVGGVVGINEALNYEGGVVRNCYNIGLVRSEDDYVGGLAGYMRDASVITCCYYDRLQCASIGAIGDKEDGADVKGLATEEMTGSAALENMEFMYGTGETGPWMEKANETKVFYYPHLRGFNFNEDGNQLQAEDIPTDSWPARIMAAATPTFNPAPGEFGPQQSIVISCATEGATIYYTTDGTDPTTSSDKYTKPIIASDTITIKAMAVKEGIPDSEIATATYNHVHSYGAWTKLDSDQHQRVCEHDPSHIEKEDHNWDDGKVTKEPTEEWEGELTYTCAECGAAETKPIAKLNHKHALVKTEKKAATCTTEGNIEYYTCSGCELIFKDDAGAAQIKKEDTVIKALSHREAVDEGKDPTCTETGLTEGKHCSICGEILEEKKVVPALGHSYGEWSKQDENKHQRVCEHNPAHIEEEDHKWDEGKVAIESTEDEEGEITYTCTVCGETKTESIAKLNHRHILVKTEGKAATCTAEGNIEYYTCSSCGHIFMDPEGTKQITKEYVVIKAFGHREVVDEGKAATCTETGLTEGKHCYLCNQVLKEQEVVPETGHKYGMWKNLDDKQHQRTCENDPSHIEKADHNWDEGKVMAEATTEKEGIRTFTCEVCQGERTEAIPKLAPPTYEARDSEGKQIKTLIWQKGSGKSLDFTINRSEEDNLTYEKFDSLDIDGSVVKSENYTAGAGSLKMSIKPEYLETLSLGDHDVKVKFRDGDALIKLEVKEAAKEPAPKPENEPASPNTGDGSSAAMYLSILILAASAIITLRIGARAFSHRRREDL